LENDKVFDMNFININLNPSGRKSCDCVVRAIVRASGKSWLETYNRLCQLGMLEHAMPNEKRVYEKHLEQIGFKKNKMPRFPDNTRFTVAEFAYSNPKGVFIISVAKHLTCVVDGVLYDTWNCGGKSVGNFYSK
jgi:hypothetical protein